MERYEQFKIRQVSHLKQPTVYYFLKEIGISETHIKNLRKNPQSIFLNGEPVTTRKIIGIGDMLEILKSAKTHTQTKYCDGNLEILFEDDDFLIVNKPHNLACTPTRSHYDMNLGGQICKYMSEKDPNFVLRILNRLDLEAAGIVIVAKNVLAYKGILKNLEKEYHAIVHGNIYKNITIDKPIQTRETNHMNEIKRVISPEGKHAITHVEVVKNMKNCCHIKLALETGRTHQIRVHLASIGHALVGDTLYGEEMNAAPTSSENNFKAKRSEPVEKTTQKNASFDAQSLPQTHTMLLLKKVSFKHFRTGKIVTVEVPFPPEWEELMKN